MPADEDVLEERRKANLVLKQLRQHQNQVEDNKDEAEDVESDALQKHFSQAEANLQKSQTVDQALVDAQIFRRLGQFTKKQAEQLQAGLRTCDLKSFVEHLRLNMSIEDGGDDDGDTSVMMNFVKFGDSVASKYRSVPFFDFMYGNEPKENFTSKPTEQRKTRQVKKGSKTDKPDELRSDEIQQTETDKQVMLMKKILEQRKRCNFWEFVIDPQDFTRTVENVFHTSFLIKDSWAQLDLKADPPILRCNDSADDAQQGRNRNSGNESISNSQYILDLDIVKWRELIEKYNIRRCILPRPRKRSGGNDSQLRRIMQYEIDVDNNDEEFEEEDMGVKQDNPMASFL